MAYPILILEREVEALKTYKELKDNFYEEVGRIDLSQLSLGGYSNTYMQYVELLLKMAELEDRIFLKQFSCCREILPENTPKVESEGE